VWHYIAQSLDIWHVAFPSGPTQLLHWTLIWILDEWLSDIMTFLFCII
jgi:hypothetical protein